MVEFLDYAWKYDEKYKNISDKDKVNCVWAFCLRNIVDTGVTSNFFEDFRKELQCRLDCPTWFDFRDIEKRILAHYNEIMDEKGWFRFLDKSSDPLLGDLLKACRMLAGKYGSDIREAYKQFEKLFSKAESNKDELVCRICLHSLLDVILCENNEYFRYGDPDRFTIFTDERKFSIAYAYYNEKRDNIAPQDRVNEIYSRMVGWLKS